MIQLLLILAIIVCLIILLLKKKEPFYADLSSITSLKATGGNGGIRLTWIKPHDNVDRYYIILKFDKDGIPNYNIYLYKNNNVHVEFHIKNIPNDYIYNVSIIYKFGDDISGVSTYKNADGTNDIITDADSPLIFNDIDSTDDDTAAAAAAVAATKCSGVQEENINMELNNIMTILINKDKSYPNGNYNVNIY
jgi:hypothetical protein